LVKICWDIECPHSNPINIWQFKMRSLREKVKGWSRNVDAEMRKTKEALLNELDALDKAVEQQQLTPQEVDRRKSLIARMDQFWRIEEIKAR
jgi:hypothetical protein